MPKIPTCEGTVPEVRTQTVDQVLIKEAITAEKNVPAIVQVDGVDTIGMELIQYTKEPAEYKDVIHETVTPESPCTSQATVISRSMKETKVRLGPSWWELVEDHYYCNEHFVHGTMTHLDKSTSYHGPIPLT